MHATATLGNDATKSRYFRATFSGHVRKAPLTLRALLACCLLYAQGLGHDAQAAPILAQLRREHVLALPRPLATSKIITSGTRHQNRGQVFHYGDENSHRSSPRLLHEVHENDAEEWRSVWAGACLRAGTISVVAHGVRQILRSQFQSPGTPASSCFQRL